MSDRDRLIELIRQGKDMTPCEKDNDYNCKGIKCEDCESKSIANYLLANGVIVPRKVKGYTDYFIDEYGNVYSLKTHKYLNQEKGKDGYYYVQLCENGKRKRASVHRLVAETFIDNPCNLPMVNHKDENRENNEVNNLEWCTEKYNTNYGNARVKQAKAVSKAVVCIETGEVFCSQKEAGQIMKVAHQHICDCCLEIFIDGGYREFTEKEILSAFEKQIPKKPIIHGYIDGREVNTISYTCPVCNKHIGRENFCKHCGQALDWSDTE